MRMKTREMNGTIAADSTLCTQIFIFFYALTLSLWVISVLFASSLVSLAREYAKELADTRYSVPYHVSGPRRGGDQIPDADDGDRAI